MDLVDQKWLDQLWTFDPAKSKELIEGLGWVMGSDGYYAKDGKQLTMEITTHEAFIEKQRIAQVLVEQFQAVGINASNRNETGAAWGDNLNFGTFDTQMGLLWVPFTYLVAELDPFALLGDLRGLTAALMFVSGAIIANATGVGGGIVFNPMLQLVFGVSGYSALVLAITVQCAGMTSGTYGWYKKGEFSHIARTHSFMMAITSAVSTALFTILFLQCRKLFASELLGVMKAASAFVSFYVFAILWKEVKEKESMGISGQAALPQGSDNELREAGALRVDRRIFPWIALGALLDVHTAVGVGELVFSHLIKYYKAPTRTAVAAGVMMQAISVVTQSVFNVLFLREYLLLDLMCIGLFCTMIGGRLAPFIMTRKVIEPYAKKALALTALAMGFTSVVMLVM